MPRPSLSLAVVGADHPNKRGPARRFELALCVPGEQIELLREPKNLADESAVAVFSARGVQLGYLSAERAPYIGKLMGETEVTAIFQRLAPFGAWIRVAFDGEVPTLPPTACAAPDSGSAEADAEPEWQPDEEWLD